MIARAIMFSTFMLSGVATLAVFHTANARPLLLSDLPPDLRSLPNARADAPAPGRTARSGWHQEGVASWYGADHAGRRTTSGAVFNPGDLTAAHATLPLGTRLRVVREDTGASVVVTVNDRIGNHRRVIDLSRGAAEVLDLVRAGTAQVRLVPDVDGVMVPTPDFVADDPPVADRATPLHRRGLRHASAGAHVVRVRSDSPAHATSHARHRT